VDDVLTYALFPEIGLKFLKNRGNPDAFEPAPTGKELEPAAKAVESTGGASVYTVSVGGESFVVQVSEGGDVSAIAPVATPSPASSTPAPAGNAEPLNSPLSGNIFKINVTVGQTVAEGDVLIILEAMKMETEVKAAKGGVVQSIDITEGSSVSVGDVLLTLA
jgi:oxaloacetate decarboxylase alpha subunit